MVRYGYKTTTVTPHYRTYTVNDGKGGYKQIKRWIERHPRRIKTGMTITQKGQVKNKIPYIARTMTKEIPENLIEGVRKLVKDQDHEYSIDIDFERRDNIPQQMLIMRGGRRETIKVGDFELFGHTHPDESYPHPSNTDLRILYPLKPEFIIAQKTGKTILLNIENYPKWVNWKYYGTDVRTNLVDSKYGRDKIFEKTGVRVYPLLKNVKIELQDDPHYEKRFPRASKTIIEKWHSK